MTELEQVKAERDRLAAALSEINRVTTWGGSWKSGCACMERIPHIGNLASAALTPPAPDRPAISCAVCDGEGGAFFSEPGNPPYEKWVACRACAGKEPSHD